MTGRERRLRAAIVGCGRIGTDTGAHGSSRIRSHAAAYSTLPETELIALCDSDPERLVVAGERWEVEGLYPDLEQMLERERIDLLSICSSPPSHLPLLESAVAQSVPGVLLEKPVATSPEEAWKAVHVAESARTKVAVNYIRRFPDAYRQVASDISRGTLGRIQLVTILYTKGIVNNGTHALDLMRFIFGDPIHLVVEHELSDSSLDPTLSFRMQFPQGFDAWFLGLAADAFNIFEVDILGVGGRVVFRDQGHLVDYYPAEDTRKKHGFRQLAQSCTSQPTELSRATEFAIQNLAQSVITGSDPACTLRDGAAALDLSVRAIGAIPEGEGPGKVTHL